MCVCNVCVSQYLTKLFLLKVVFLICPISGIISDSHNYVQVQSPPNIVATSPQCVPFQFLAYLVSKQLSPKILPKNIVFTGLHSFLASARHTTKKFMHFTTFKVVFSVVFRFSSRAIRVNFENINDEVVHGTTR